MASRPLTHRTGLALLLLTAGSAMGTRYPVYAQTAPPKTVPTKSTPAKTRSPRPFYNALVGLWKGSLTYRDYSSDKMVTLPTTLTVYLTPNAKSLRLRYVYDDGPGKTVEDTDIVTLDPTGKTYTVQSEGSKTATIYAASGLETFAKDYRGTLTLLGKGEDAGKPADVRNTITRKGKTLTLLHEARQKGDVFKFRNRHEFILSNPAPSAAAPDTKL